MNLEAPPTQADVSERQQQPLLVCWLSFSYLSNDTFNTGVVADGLSAILNAPLPVS
jgi:hypothetical protein